MTADWKENPPLVFLVDSLVRGLGGIGGGRVEGTSNSPPARTDEFNIHEFARLAGPSIPVVRKDPNLPKNPVFDEDVLRAKNVDRIKAAINAGRKSQS